MAESDSSRPWVPQELVVFYEKHSAHYRTLDHREFEGEVAQLLRAASNEPTSLPAASVCPCLMFQGITTACGWVRRK